jgi:predicted dehydrogenase
MFEQLPNCKVVSVCDYDPAHLKRIQALDSNIHVTHDANELIDHPSVQVVSIASYDQDHFAHALKAIHAGKHVFVEKPICQTLDQAKQIKKALDQRSPKVRFASNLILRAAPLYQWLRTQIQEGHLGEIYSFDGEYLYGRIHKITEGWRKSVDDYSVMEGGGIHLIDLMIWLTGQRPDRLSTVGNRIATRNTEFRYNDFMATTLSFSSGLIGRITANFGCVHRHQHVLKVFGTKGTFILDDAGPRLHMSRDPQIPATEIQLATKPATKGALIPAFVESISQYNDLTSELQLYFDGMSICSASDVSLKTKTMQEITYL